MLPVDAKSDFYSCSFDKLTILTTTGKGRVVACLTTFPVLLNSSMHFVGDLSSMNACCLVLSIYKYCLSRLAVCSTVT